MRRVLLIEDSSDDEVLTLRALQRSQTSCTVDVARDGEEALAYLFDEHPSGDAGSVPPAGPPSASRPAPDLVLLDLKLPKIDGLAVLARIRSDPRTRLIPVVVLTSSNERRDVLESYGRGANSYIRKPLDYQEFARVAQLVGAYWLQINEQA